MIGKQRMVSEQEQMTIGITESINERKDAPTRSRWQAPLAGVVLGFAAALSPIAAPTASAVGLMVGNSFTSNGLNIEVTGCSYSVASSVVGCGSGTLLDPYKFEIQAAAGPGATLNITGVGGGNLLTASLGTSRLDLSIDLLITAINPGTTVNQVSMGMSGSASCTTCPGFPFSPIGRAVTMGENFTPNAQPTVALTAVNLTDPNRTSSVFTSVSSLSVHKDIAVRGDLAGVGTLVLSYVSQSYLPAPEPASIALFSVGAAGLVAVRRRRARKQAAQA